MILIRRLIERIMTIVDICTQTQPLGVLRKQAVLIFGFFFWKFVLLVKSNHISESPTCDKAHKFIVEFVADSECMDEYK